MDCDVSRAADALLRIAAVTPDLTPTATLLPAAGPTCSARCCRPPQRPHHARPVSPRGRGLGRPPAPSVGRRRRSRTHSGRPRDGIRIVGRCRAGCCSNAAEGRRRGKTPSLHGTRCSASWPGTRTRRSRTSRHPAGGGIHPFLGARGAWTGDGSFAARDAWPVLYGKGQSPVSAPRTLRAAVTKGQHSAAEPGDRYRLRNVEVRNLLVDCVNRRFREQTGATALHWLRRTGPPGAVPAGGDHPLRRPGRHAGRAGRIRCGHGVA